MSRPRIDFGRIGLDLGIGIGLAVVWFGLGALILWPFGKAALCGHLGKGYPLYVVALMLAMLVSIIVQKVFRLESDPPRDPFVTANIVISAFVQAGWAAFVALAVRSFTPEASLFAMSALHLVGFIGSYITTATTGAFFQGSVYKTIDTLVAAVAYILFAFWPGAAHAIYGWFFALV